jgi:hypothetical protein
MTAEVIWHPCLNNDAKQFLSSFLNTSPVPNIGKFVGVHLAQVQTSTNMMKWAKHFNPSPVFVSNVEVKLKNSAS